MSIKLVREGISLQEIAFAKIKHTINMPDPENTIDRKPREINTAIIGVERFWNGVDVRGNMECWPWKKGRNYDGYGVIAEPRIKGRRRQVLLTHRVAWVIANGPIPLGLNVCHTCDNPPCCNPSHYFLGDNKDNTNDKISKGRQCRGESNGAAVLTKEAVIKIRADHSNGIKVAEIALANGICQAHVYKLINREAWLHV